MNINLLTQSKVAKEKKTFKKKSENLERVFYLFTYFKDESIEEKSQEEESEGEIDCYLEIPRRSRRFKIPYPAARI